MDSQGGTGPFQYQLELKCSPKNYKHIIVKPECLSSSVSKGDVIWAVHLHPKL